MPVSSNMMTQDQADHNSLAGELMDAHVAMLIVIWIAFLLKIDLGLRARTAGFALIRPATSVWPYR